MNKIPLCCCMVLAIIIVLTLNNGKITPKITTLFLLMILGIQMLGYSIDKSQGKLECFDGSEVAFDKEAFENLNAVVKEIADSGNMTVPANLIVKGNVSVNGDTNLNKKLVTKGDATLEKNVVVKVS